MQSALLAISKIFSSSQTEILNLLNNDSPFPPSPDLNNHDSFSINSATLGTYHINGIIQCLSFCVWLTFIMFSTFIHIVMCVRILYLFKIEYVTFYVYAIFHLCVRLLMKDFLLLLSAVVSNATLNMGVQVCVWVPAFDYFEYASRMNSLAHIVILCLIVWETCWLL